MTYREIVNEFTLNPRDVCTVPLNRRAPKWFYVTADSNALYAVPAKEHAPSCRISYPRKIEEKKFDAMLDIYHRRKAGEPVSQEAKGITINQVYWFGIFSGLEH